MSFENYLRTYTKDKANAAQFKTHTRIGNKDLGVYGGVYHVPLEKRDAFYKAYYDHMFKRAAPAGAQTLKTVEHLTEYQLPDDYTNAAGEHVNGAFMIDLDFHYDTDIRTRQHTKSHIDDMICAYTEELKKYYQFAAGDHFDLFVFEKTAVNCKPDVTKDGIHLIIGIQAERAIQGLLRKSIMPALSGDVFRSLPLKNDWDSILDDTITKATTPWQLFGSRKPGYEPYRVTYVYTATYDADDGEFGIECEAFAPNSVISYDLFMRLSARYDAHPRFPLTAEARQLADRAAAEGKRSQSGSKITPSRRRIIIDDVVDDSATGVDDLLFTSVETVAVNRIRNQEQLDRAIDLMLQTFRASTATCHLPEIHEYVQILPEEFYKAGSHALNRKVAFALKNTDNRMFLSWIKLRTKAADFDYATIPGLYRDWCQYFNQDCAGAGAADGLGSGLTKKSIIYWAKQYAPTEFARIKRSAITTYIDATLAFEKEHPEYDVAYVLYQMYKDEYLFIINGKSREWYRFQNHRWVIEPNGTALNLAISNELRSLYKERQDFYTNEILTDKSGGGGGGVGVGGATTSDQPEMDVTEVEKQIKDRAKYLKSKVISAGMLYQKLGKNGYKGAVMQQAEHLFLDREFEAMADENRFLMGFSNGVYDFNEKRLRPGKPEDYITQTTKYAYIPYDETSEYQKRMRAEINEFMGKIFTDKSLRDFMWEHLASATIGTNSTVNQTGCFYTGCGSNGKTKITDLMKFAFGTYACEGQVQLLMQERGKAEAAAPQILKFKGKRYITYPEPKKGDVLNDGIFKQITGEANLSARGLFKGLDLEFANQGCHAVATNNLMKIDDTTDGTWRRVRVVPYTSVFVDEDKYEQKVAEHGAGLVFLKDMGLDAKLAVWAPYFMTMLIEIVQQTQGRVKDCTIVLSASDKYRKTEDIVANFLAENVAVMDNRSFQIKRNELWTRFKSWHNDTYTTRMTITQAEVYEAMNKKHGKFATKHYWSGVQIIYEHDDDEAAPVAVAP